MKRKNLFLAAAMAVVILAFAFAANAQQTAEAIANGQYYGQQIVNPNNGANGQGSGSMQVTTTGPKQVQANAQMAGTTTNTVKVNPTDFMVKSNAATSVAGGGNGTSTSLDSFANALQSNYGGVDNGHGGFAYGAGVTQGVSWSDVNSNSPLQVANSAVANGKTTGQITGDGINIFTAKVTTTDSAQGGDTGAGPQCLPVTPGSAGVSGVANANTGGFVGNPDASFGQFETIANTSFYGINPVGPIAGNEKITGGGFAKIWNGGADVSVESETTAKAGVK